MHQWLDANMRSKIKPSGLALLGVAIASDEHEREGARFAPITSRDGGALRNTGSWWLTRSS
jgi:hypothetical protein